MSVVTVRVSLGFTTARNTKRRCVRHWSGGRNTSRRFLDEGNMPKGKAAIVGAIGWSHARVLPETVGDLQLLLRWKLPQHRGPTAEESERLREQIRDVLGSYFGYKASTPLLTETERRKLISMTQRGKIHPEVLDVNTRAMVYRRR